MMDFLASCSAAWIFLSAIVVGGLDVEICVERRNDFMYRKLHSSRVKNIDLDSSQECGFSMQRTCLRA